MRYTCGWAIAALIFASGCLKDPAGDPNDVECDDDVPADQRVGEPCSVGSDACAAEGSYVCAADGSGTECDAEAAEAGAEVCDGADNDCDGEVDEDFQIGEACTAGLGACEAAGVIACGADGAAACDAAAGTPADADLCGDGIDNDCDGEVDEGFDTLGDVCTSGDGVCAVEGTVICSEDALTAVCDAVPLDATEAEESICDGLDNDCDAMVDEGCDDDADGYCDATMTVEAGSEATCVSGAGDCDDENDAVNPAGAPACDGLDNNCDGTADNLLPTTNLAVELSAPLLSGTDSSPILVAPGDDGFCIVYNGKPSASTSRYRAYFSSVTQSLNEAKTGGSDDYLEDLLFAQGTCIASIRSEDSDNTIDGELERWTKNLGTVVDAEVLTDAIYNFSDTTWTTALAVSGNLLVNAYLSNASTDAYYITVPINFSGSVIPSAAHIAGKLGKHPVLAASPVVGQFLFGSEFINSYNAFKLTVGTDAVRQDTLHISDAGAHKSIETVAGITYLSMFVDSNPPVYEIREILSNLDYGRLIEIPMGPEATFEFINRRLFAGAPAPALATFANTVEDRLQVISDDGAGGFAYVDVADSRGDLLGVRDAGNDVYEAVWMTTSGNVAASENAKLEVVQYTCH